MVKKVLACAVAVGVVLAAAVVLGQAKKEPEAGAGQVVKFLKDQFGYDVELKESSKDPKTGFTLLKLMVQRGAMKYPAAAYLVQGKYLVLGSIWDLEKRQNLTVEHLKDLRPEQVKVDPQRWIKPPYIGADTDKTAVLIAGTKCPHCRKLVPELLDRLSKEKAQVKLAYFSYQHFTPPGDLKLIECTRQKKPELFWQVVRALYAEDEEAAKKLLSDNGFDANKACADVTVQGGPEPPIDGVPSLITPEGKVLVGSEEIKAYLFAAKEEKS